MSEFKNRFCDNEGCESRLQIEPATYVGVMGLDWMNLTRGNGETHHFCCIECAKAWIAQVTTRQQENKDAM